MVIKDKLQSKQADELFRAMATLQSPQECRAFLRDLCTLGELEVMMERFQVAKLLRAKLPYRRISEQTGASTATITRVAYWFNHGTGGYETILERLG